MREPKTMKYTCGLIAVMVGFGLYSYRVRELLASLVLLTMGYFLLGLVALGAVLIWSGSETVAVRTAPVSRKFVDRSRRFLIAYKKPRAAVGVISKCNF
jgi:hypothetical protein